MDSLTYKEFAARYCKRMENNPDDLWVTLESQQRTYQPEGWMLLECVDLASSRLGHYVILPYGPKNTYKAPPERPISPRGLCSDMSEVVAILKSENLEYPR